jgi:tripartite-type tricarboxylate transporter receptor subunit TctC
MASTGAILTLAASHPGGARYHVTRDLAPVSLVAAPPYILVAEPSQPFRTAADIISFAKSNPGKLSFGSSGVGSASHLSGALFAQMAGIDMLHVPYRGTGPAVTDLLGGRINLMFSPALTGTPREIVEKLAADVKKVLLLPQSKQKLAQEGAEPEPNSPEAFTAFVNADIAKWLDLAQKAGIKLAN